MRFFVYWVLFLSMAIGGINYAQEPVTKHAFTVHDLLAMDRISGQTVSPDGKRIAFVIRKTDLEANSGRTDIWLIGVDGTELKRLTDDPAGDFNPCWSRDGRTLFFLSTRSGSSQVWRMSVDDGGGAVQVTKFPLSVGNLKISPDGIKLAVTMEVFPNSTIEETVKRIDEIKNRKYSGKIYEKLLFRHWDTWEDGRRSHIFVIPTTGGEAVDIMKAWDVDCPLKPFGGSEEFTFTPDSQAIVFTAINNSRNDHAWSTNYDLFLSPIDGSKIPSCLTEGNLAWDTTPLFSPDGQTLAYKAMGRAGFEADRFKLILRTWSNGEERILANDWDRSCGSFAWGPRGRTMYVIAANLGQTSLFAIDVNRATVTTLIRDGRVTSIDFSGRDIVYGKCSLGSPVELFSIDRRGRAIRHITSVNAEKLRAIKMGDYEQFTFKGWNNETVYCYIVKPTDFNPQKKYPVAFLIHGGPQGSFGNHFHYRWNPQVYSGAGYAAVMVDFHGSVGYGQAFTDSITGDWGGKPLEDLQKGLAAALNRYSWMDAERVAALGASFGGYMVNWIAGNWPDRFKCLVNHDGNLDERLAYFDTEELWFPEWEHGGTPWTNPQGYEKHNPINFVKNWKTPMLVIHGALDFRVVETQGFSTFTALQRRGIPSKLLYFPDENHWVLKPHNSILWHDTVLGWLNEWIKN
jgi:dipeptidyl aminopeptidase/acylaminoacyl peptidase